MGYRLHYAKNYNPDWRGGGFSWSAEEWEELFYNKFYSRGWKEEGRDQYEVDREDLARYIEDLGKLKPNRKNRFLGDLTNSEAARELQEILDGTDDTQIRIEWY